MNCNQPTHSFQLVSMALEQIEVKEEHPTKDHQSEHEKTEES